MFIELDKDANIIDYQIEKTIINSKKKMTYEKVNQILEENIYLDEYEEFIPIIKEMEKLSNKLTKRRMINGYIDFDTSEINFEINDNNEVNKIIVSKQRTAEEIIENFMILANITIIEYLTNLGIPSIYRNHEIPNIYNFKEELKLLNSIGYDFEKLYDLTNPKTIQKILTSFKKYEEFNIISNLLLSHMSKAYYSPNNNGHFALGGLDYYTHFTSPIRRFSDLIIHTMLDYADDYENNYEKIVELSNELDQICKHISYKERQADKAEREANELATIKYMQNHLGENFIGYVTDINNTYIKIRTTELIDGIIYLDNLNYIYDEEKHILINKRDYEEIKIGDKLNLTSENVDLCKMKVIFELDGKINQNNNPKKLIHSKIKK